MNSSFASLARLLADLSSPSRDDWASRCAIRLQQIGKLITDEHAEDQASQLYRAWPKLEPEEAAEAFLRPQD